MSLRVLKFFTYKICVAINTHFYTVRQKCCIIWYTVFTKKILYLEYSGLSNVYLHVLA